jgi:hypothetical protein
LLAGIEFNPELLGGARFPQKLITKQWKIKCGVGLSNIEGYIEQISQKIDEGRVVLFLGAGASTAANASQQDG